MQRSAALDALAAVHEWRALLWPLAASRPQGPLPRAASRVRAALVDAEGALHDFVREHDRALPRDVPAARLPHESG